MKWAFSGSLSVTSRIVRHPLLEHTRRQHFARSHSCGRTARDSASDKRLRALLPAFRLDALFLSWRDYVSRAQNKREDENLWTFHDHPHFRRDGFTYPFAN